MDNLDFFLGERSYTFLRKLYRGKAQLKWTVTERWDERLGRSLNCGMERTYKLKKLLGVSSVEREDLESTVSNSIGKKGLFELKAEVKHKLAKELRLEETWEEEEEFHFQAPKCGRLTLRVYQFKRLHEFSYEDNRFWLWRKANFKRTITEWVNHLYDNSVTDTDPACKCDEGGGDGIEGLVLEFPSLNLILPKKRVEEMLFQAFDLDKKTIPSYLLFLSGETSPTLTGRFLPLSSTTFSEAIGYFVRRQSSPPLEIEVGQKSQSESTNLIYLLLGAASGVGAALLLAPQSGEELRGDIADATRKGIDRSREAAKQLGVKASEYYDATRAKTGELYYTAHETAEEYYEATRERAAELYDIATSKAAEVMTNTRDAASRQAGSISAGVEAEKKAYLEEKRKTELSDHTEAAPTYKPERAT